jgi:ABC-type lipoprotein export system ATPase subunit
MTARKRLEEQLHRPVRELLADFSYIGDFFANLGIGVPSDDETPYQYFSQLPAAQLEDLGVERESLPERLVSFLILIEKLQAERGGQALESVTVLGGHDKSGQQEDASLTLRPGDIVCLVGPTGSGKSRFLADIEWLAQGDSPTGRTVLINGAVPEPGMRFAIDRKLVAQLSQNMNFVMDLTVEEFVTMHAESRLVEDTVGVAASVIALANDLAGERFTPQTPVTSLSGGQSRALMIADTSCLSRSPIVLIDEIENAGIDRKRAVRTLVDKRKIVLIATHDPILALLGERRLVFKNGGISRIIETSAAERRQLAHFEELDARLNAVRLALRNGEMIA